MPTHPAELNSPMPLNATPAPSRSLPLRLGLLAALLAPFSIVPYLLMRRRNSSLLRSISELKLIVTRLRRESGFIASQQLATRQSLHRTTTTLDDAVLRIEDLRKHMKAQDALRTEIDGTVNARLSSLLAEHDANARSLHASMRDVGTSLASIASFVHELQLERGYPSKTMGQEEIEALRMTAYHLQRFPKPEGEESRKSSAPSTPTSFHTSTPES